MISPEDLKKYQDLMAAEDLLELEVRDGDFHLRLSRGKPSAAPAAFHPAVLPPASVASPEPSPAAPPPSAEPAPAGASITSPLSGVFYRAASPSTPPFVKEGDKVSPGDVLCIVEAMKVMNEIRADKACVIKKILADNGKPVSSGQGLFLIDPSA